MAKSTAKNYRIGNPRGVPKGIRIMVYGDEEWFEGDEFVAPPGFLPKYVQQRIDEGYIVEVEA